MSYIVAQLYGNFKECLLNLLTLQVLTAHLQNDQLYIYWKCHECSNLQHFFDCISTSTSNSKIKSKLNFIDEPQWNRRRTECFHLEEYIPQLNTHSHSFSTNSQSRKSKGTNPSLQTYSLSNIIAGKQPKLSICTNVDLTTIERGLLLKSIPNFTTTLQQEVQKLNLKEGLRKAIQQTFQSKYTIGILWNTDQHYDKLHQIVNHCILNPTTLIVLFSDHSSILDFLTNEYHLNSKVYIYTGKNKIIHNFILLTQCHKFITFPNLPNSPTLPISLIELYRTNDRKYIPNKSIVLDEFYIDKQVGLKTNFETFTTTLSLFSSASCKVAIHSICDNTKPIVRMISNHVKPYTLFMLYNCIRNLGETCYHYQLLYYEEEASSQLSPFSDSTILDGMDGIERIALTSPITFENCSQFLSFNTTPISPIYFVCCDDFFILPTTFLSSILKENTIMMNEKNEFMYYYNPKYQNLDPAFASSASSPIEYKIWSHPSSNWFNHVLVACIQLYEPRFKLTTSELDTSVPYSIDVKFTNAIYNDDFNTDHILNKYYTSVGIFKQMICHPNYITNYFPTAEIYRIENQEYVIVYEQQLYRIRQFYDTVYTSTLTLNYFLKFASSSSSSTISSTIISSSTFSSRTQHYDVILFIYVVAEMEIDTMILQLRQTLPKYITYKIVLIIPPSISIETAQAEDNETITAIYLLPTCNNDHNNAQNGYKDSPILWLVIASSWISNQLKIEYDYFLCLEAVAGKNSSLLSSSYWKDVLYFCKHWIGMCIKNGQDYKAYGSHELLDHSAEGIKKQDIYRKYMIHDHPIQVFQHMFFLGKQTILNTFITTCKDLIVSAFSNPFPVVSIPIAVLEGLLIEQHQHVHLYHNTRDHVINGRNGTMNNEYCLYENLPANFSCMYYRLFNSDLEHFTDDTELIQHYLQHGQFEHRWYQLPYDLPLDFDVKTYKEMNCDLATLHDGDAIRHFIENGQQEGRCYQKENFFSTTLPLNVTQLNEYIETTEQYYDQCCVFINHESNISGAPLFLYDYVVYLKTNNIFKNIIIFDVYPNAYYINNYVDPYNLIVLYHHNKVDGLVTLLQTLNPVFIYSNSLNIYTKHVQLFKEFYYKTIFHFHETYTFLSSFMKQDIKTLWDQHVYVVSPSIQMEYLQHQFTNVRLFSPFISNAKNEVVQRLFEEGIKEQDIWNWNNSQRLNPTKIIIGMCGNIDDFRKNFELFYIICSQHLQYEFVWIGGKQLSARYKKYPPNFFFIPTTSNVYAYYKQLDYFFLTSREDPCPTVILENLFIGNRCIVIKNCIKYEHERFLTNVAGNYMVLQNGDLPKLISQFRHLHLHKKQTIYEEGRQYIMNKFRIPTIHQITSSSTSLSSPAKHILIFSIHWEPKFIQRLSLYKNLLQLYQLLQYPHSFDILFMISKQTDHAIQEPATMQFYYNDSLDYYTYSCKDTETENPQICDTLRHQFKFINQMQFIFCKNKGYDIGKFLTGLHYLQWNGIWNAYEYVTALHTKSNVKWCNELHKIFYISDLQSYDTICSDKFHVQYDNTDLNAVLIDQLTTKFELTKKDIQYYVGGTVFTTKLMFFNEFIKQKDTQFRLYKTLTDIYTNDLYWQQIMMNSQSFLKYYEQYKCDIYNKPIDLDSRQVMIEKQCKNYFELWFVYHKRGIPDCQLEHALERYFGGLICDPGLKVLLV